MSQEDQDAAVVRIVKERAALKRTRALLQNELRLAGLALLEIANPLSQISEPGNAEIVVGAISRHAELFGGSRLAAIVREYAEASNAIAQLDQSAMDAGID